MEYIEGRENYPIFPIPSIVTVLNYGYSFLKAITADYILSKVQKS
jgi:hypothetical protein